jgi:P4 family phage/plasmid primase-like protien
MKEFWEKYTIAKSLNQPTYLAENPGKEIPILVDIDLKLKKSSLPDSFSRIYTYDQVKQVIGAYQKAIRDVVDNPREDAYTCVLLEKDPYEVEIAGEKYVKNGFHLHFPKIFLDKKVQEVYIIPIVKKLIPTLFENIGIKDFIDANSLNVHWLLYGSKKQNASKPYVATRCFGNSVVEIDFEKALGEYKINKYVGEEASDVDCKNRVEEFLPRILSIFLYNRADLYYYNPKESVTTPLFDEFQKVKAKRKEYDQLSVDAALEEANILLKMMNDDRAYDRATWFTVGCCLWNITHGDDDGLTSWLEFSERAEDKFNESECLSMWHKQMRPNNYTIGTLKYYAKKDSPKAYEEMMNEKTNTLFAPLIDIEAVNGCHNDIAKILLNEYGNEFKCTSIAAKEWYQFKNHIWKAIDRGTALRERISSNEGIIIKQLNTKKKDIMREKEHTDDPGALKDIEKRIKKINDLIKSCKSAPFKNCVIVECQEVFYDAEFYKLLNKDPYLIAFNNGVYDFVNDVFRDGNPEDYLSVALPIDYVDYGSVDHHKVMVVDDFFQKVFPDPAIRDYFLNQACQVFVGGNHDKVMLFWTGSGNNGKTVTQTLFEKMLGRLAIKFSTTLITGKKTQTGSANPELARAGDGVRWAVMEEPNPDEMINTGTLKGLTGNDSFWARDLFQRGKETCEIQPLFKLHMICNNLPAIRDADIATWNRIRVIPFESIFLPEQDCPSDIDDQIRQKKFPMDKNFTNKIPELTQPLAWYLIQRWRATHKLNRDIEPEKVKVATDVYRQDNDVYKQFENQCVFEKNGSKLSPAVLYAHFKEWFKEECPNQMVPPRIAVVKQFVNLWGALVNGKHWANKTCREPTDDEKADKASNEPGPSKRNTDPPNRRKATTDAPNRRKATTDAPSKNACNPLLD